MPSRLTPSIDAAALVDGHVLTSSNVSGSSWTIGRSVTGRRTQGSLGSADAGPDTVTVRAHPTGPLGKERQEHSVDGHVGAVQGPVV